jgi:hypothetical protein
MYITFAILGALAIFLLGALALPALIFIRARRDKSWDDSNVTNIYRVIAHLAAHPSDFGRMSFEDGKLPFWYINKDEFGDVVDTRPNKDE